MGAVCRFVDEGEVRAARAGCPLRACASGGPPSTNESACAGCAHNAAWPGEPTLGCRVAVPGPVWRAAVAQLGDVDPKLLHDVHGLRGRDLDEGDLSAAAAVLARWVAVVDVNDAGLECARTAQAFVRCAVRTQSGVRLWE